ncbi:alpha/beta hydrolase [Spirosoma sp.]|uniref:alpha/beta fold hydrolase n=1 Tax=Spirosoma sp. TaxID=1899569 RepID=UPI00261ECA73|nr:alpha/beta hydrolase [Spirosoma sp.]MCX6217961.1 alpha/beta hydrolase [Spirosoma sp.]
MSEDQHCQIEGLTWRIRQNAGPTILWLHGYTMNNQIWSIIWDKLPGYSHLAPDLPGHGRSCGIQEIQGLEQLATQIAQTARSLNAQYLVGLSFGGIVGLQIAIQYPSSFMGMVLNSSPVGGMDVDLDAQTKNLELVRLYQEKGNGPWLTEAWIKSPPHIFTGIKQSENWPFLLQAIEQHRWEELADNQFARFLAHRQLVPALRSIDFPCLYLLGDEDMSHIKRSAELLKQQYKKLTRKYLEGCGHLALFEKPATTLSLINEYFLSLT